MIVVKIVGTILAKKIDEKYFGGTAGKVTHTFSRAMFYLSIYRALTAVKKKNGKPLADELANAVREATPVRTGKLRDSVRVVEGKNGNYQVVVGGTPETMIRYKNGVFDQALGIEYGTRNRAAHAFYWPTVQRYQKKIEKSLGSAIEQEFS